MDYYTRKQKAVNEIEVLIMQVEDLKILELKRAISKKYGFGDLFIKNQLKELQEMGKIKIKENKVYWLEK